MKKYFLLLPIILFNCFACAIISDINFIEKDTIQLIKKDFHLNVQFSHNNEFCNVWIQQDDTRAAEISVEYYPNEKFVLIEELNINEPNNEDVVKQLLNRIIFLYKSIGGEKIGIILDNNQTSIDFFLKHGFNKIQTKNQSDATYLFKDIKKKPFKVYTFNKETNLLQ